MSTSAIFNQTNTRRNYWWLVASGSRWDLSTLPIGGIESYSPYDKNGRKTSEYQNFVKAKVGDIVIGYKSSPERHIVALLIVERITIAEIYFKKIDVFANPIPFVSFKDEPVYKATEAGIKNNQGSLFGLAKIEFDYFMQLIRLLNPVTRFYHESDFLKEVYMEPQRYHDLVAILERKKNIIIQGAPGVGKTFAAKRLAYSIMGEKNESQIKLIQFHQSYSYEDFVMGYKPKVNGFELVYGKFYEFCMLAKKTDEVEEAEGINETNRKKFFFIIDEINRGNISKIFGELLMLIENDYRDITVELAYEKKPFSVPKNVYIIGLMNTADRSLAMIDYALRRRFSFFEMSPQFNSRGFQDYILNLNNSKLNKLVDAIKELNTYITDDTSLGKGFCIGHSYLCGQNASTCTDEWLEQVIEFDLLPMLEEYWFDNLSKVNIWATNLRDALK